MTKCSFPPHYTTYAGSGISCPACGEVDTPIPPMVATVTPPGFDLVEECFGVFALLLAVATLALFLVLKR